jgi:hypothetical protein
VGEAFIGSEAVATGRLTPYQLRSRFVTVYPDVYVPRRADMSAVNRAKAAWLWSRRRGVVAGVSAAALHGARWVDAHAPAELVYDNRHSPRGIVAFGDRLADDEVGSVGGMRVTTPVRTALDIARRMSEGPAVATIDALAHATDLKIADVELLAERYRGSRGIRRARDTLTLVDPGAESPRETWLRLLVIRNGFPRPQSQIPVHDEYGQLVAVVDMGWEDIKLALDYEGAHHRDPGKFAKDIQRHDALTDLGWIDIRVTSRDTEGGIVRRLQTAFARRV